MTCPKCGVEALISGSRMEVSGDNSPETPTVVETVLTYRCRNPQCAECGHEVGESRHRQYPAEE